MKLKHEPMRPARDNHPEAVYLEVYQRLLKNIDILGHIFGERELDQRDATVTATFMCYLGTNGGASLLRMAENLSGPVGHREDGYVAAWALHNRRRHGVNHGIRCLEHMMAPEYLISDNIFGRVKVDVWGKTMDTLTIRDQDTIEEIMVWLAGNEGRLFIKAADAEIEAERERDRFMRATKEFNGGGLDNVG